MMATTFLGEEVYGIATLGDYAASKSHGFQTETLVIFANQRLSLCGAEPSYVLAMLPNPASQTASI